MTYYGGEPGLPKDHAKALVWLRKAVAQGDHFSRLVLGRMLKRGEGGLAKDPKEARRLRELVVSAAAQRNVEARAAVDQALRWVRDV